MTPSSSLHISRQTLGVPGNMVNSAALTIGNKVNTPTSYQYPSVITIENTTVQSTGDYSDSFPAMYVWANANPDYGVTITYDADTKFIGNTVYGNDGNNITVNN